MASELGGWADMERGLGRGIPLAPGGYATCCGRGMCTLLQDRRGLSMALLAGEVGKAGLDLLFFLYCKARRGTHPVAGVVGA